MSNTLDLALNKPRTTSRYRDLGKCFNNTLPNNGIAVTYWPVELQTIQKKLKGTDEAITDAQLKSKVFNNLPDQYQMRQSRMHN